MSKSSKADLLVRVRFENPLPEPPFPPKLVNVNTEIGRLGEPSYLSQLASSTPLPMLLDVEMGMPIDLNAFEGVWDGDDAALNPLPNPDVSRLDTADQDLCTPLRILGSADTAKPSQDVSWMRNSSYIQRREGATRRREAIAAQKAEVVDCSEAAQILAIEKTFRDIKAQPVEGMRHPDAKRKHLRVVESYDILPDDEAWGNSYIIFKFPDRPSAATAVNPTGQASRQRLEHAVMRPSYEDDQQMVQYFLPREDDLGRLEEMYENPHDDETVQRLRENYDADNETVDEIFPNVPFDRIRTYEVVSQQPPQKEVLITFREQDDDDVDDMFGDDDDGPARKKRKGVYFKEITMRTQLRKTRAKRASEAEVREDTWDKVRVAFREPDADEAANAAERAEQITDPSWPAEQVRRAHGEVDAHIDEGRRELAAEERHELQDDEDDDE